jgi:serine protease Do
VSIQDVDKGLASSFGLDKPRGALVAQLVPNSPSQGMLQDGDIILTFNSNDIKKSGDLPHFVGATPAGTSVTLKVLRNRSEKIVTVKLGELPDDPAQQTVGKISAPSLANPAEVNILGLVVEAVDMQARKQLNINGGVVVREVTPGSPADITGLIPGDVITQLGLVAINNEVDFKKQCALLQKGSPQAIRFFRGGQPVFRTILVR